MNNTSLEEPAIKIFKNWLGEERVICPAPFDFELVENIMDRSPEAAKVVDFMESMLGKYGENSVIYVSVRAFFFSVISLVWIVLTWVYILAN